ncbi:MAG: hypothetical protein ABI833_23240 [Acidobacteriota bacterium]
MRDQIVDFVRRWSEKTGIGAGQFIAWLGITVSKFYDWRERYGQVNGHNGWVPRDFWLEAWEKQAIVDFHLRNPLEGYRRLTFMMQTIKSFRHLRVSGQASNAANNLLSVIGSKANTLSGKLRVQRAQRCVSG